MALRQALAAALVAAAIPTAIARNSPQPPPQPVVGIASDMWAGTDAKACQDLQSFDNADPTAELRMVCMSGRGAVDNLKDILYLRGVDVGFVQADAVRYAVDNNLIPAADLSHVQYISKLYDAEVHILARAAIATIGDLEGKKVNVDVAGSGSAITADVLFRALKIQPVVTHDRQADGLLALRRGEIDAIVQVGGAPVPLFASVTGDLHFLSIPLDQALVSTYLPSELTATEYPNLVHDDPVETLAIGDVLAVYGWPRDAPRYRNVARFVDALFNRFSNLQQPPHHPKWRDVNLGAAVPGWVRFDEAQAKLRDKFVLDWLTQVAADRGRVVLTPTLRAEMERNFEGWRARGL